MDTSRIARMFRLIFNPIRLLETIIIRTPRIWSDVFYLKAQFHWVHGYKLDVNNPKSFSEKLQWLKLYNYRDEHAIIVDKVKVKDWVAKRIGSEYIIPTLGVWERPEEIDFDALPNKFILKCNHNSAHGLCICKDKQFLDKNKAIKYLRKGLAEDYFLCSRERAYHEIPRRIIAETLIEDPSGDLKDYKLFCFGGRVYYTLVYFGRHNEEKLHMIAYDRDWLRQPFYTTTPATLSENIPCPPNYEKMIEIAESLSKGLLFARIDLYNTNGHIYFGEITLHPAGGMAKVIPSEWDYKLGSLLTLPISQTPH